MSNQTEKNNDTLRVQVELLDALMNQIGELVLIKNQVIQVGKNRENSKFLTLSQRLNVVTSELQAEVMKTRMQPIGSALTKFQRITRDLSKSLGKKLELKLEGTSTELDKSLVEAIKDPLTHIVRNSVDHGMEKPEERLSAGKPEVGTLLIKAYHEGGQVVIAVTDDGKGIDPERIKKSALEKGFIDAHTLEKMSDKELQNLIFYPGFSSAAEVTNISGRGVGMDVVKTNIEKIGGQVVLDSTKGKGTTILFKIPLTLAIVPALIVESGKHQFAIPQVKLVELVRVSKEQTDKDKSIEILQGRPMYRLRGKLLPLVSLSETLTEVKSVSETTAEIEEAIDSVHFAVLNADGINFGLLISNIVDSTDIVVKPLNDFLSSIKIYSGATILGDGSVALTLDINGIAEHAGLQNNADVIASQIEGKMNSSKDLLEFLVFKLSEDRQFSIPLINVHRLEEMSCKDIEFSSDQTLIQYRDGILPLIDLNQKFPNHGHAGPKNDRDDEKIEVIVTEKGGKKFGLVVDEICEVKIIMSEIQEQSSKYKHCVGHVVLADKITPVIDVPNMINDHLGIKSFHMEHEPTSQQQNNEAAGPQAGAAQARILLAEDNGFYRKHVKNLLEESNFAVEAFEDGAKALDYISQCSEDYFDLIISDIEMPNMDGFEFCKALNDTPKFQSIPKVAVTTLISKKDLAKSREVGFDHHLEKLNAEELTATVKQLLSQKDNKAA